MPADLSGKQHSSQSVVAAATAQRTRRPSKKDPDEDKFDSPHMREIELKRSRGEISCAECRRLKIRCDKSIPCKSCQRRGCAALCPNGSLATGQGTRFVLAATEYLHKRIGKMTERIRQLEDALAILQARCSNEPHPLLREDAVVSKLEPEDEENPSSVEPAHNADIIDTFGTLSVSDHGVSRFFGPTGGSEYLLFTENDTPPPSPSPESQGVSPDSGRDSMTPPFNGELTRFSASFPFTPIGSPAEVQQLVEQYLPPWERATYLAETYLENAGWLFRGITRQQLVSEMLPVIYKRPLPDPAHVGSLDYTGPHDLALVLLVFAVGSLVDMAQDSYSAEGEHYHHLARAALGLQPVLEKPSIVAIQALRLLSIYTAMAGRELRGSETTMETTWSLLALSAQLAQSIGLHRDSARWGLSKCMVNRRRLLFWDLFIGDSWQSLTTGRPPSFTRDYIDCKYPALQHVDVTAESEDQEDEEDEEENDNDFNTWGCRFALECVAEVAARALAAEPPSYAIILELDRKVREFPIPPEVIAVLEDLKSPSVDEEPVSLTKSMERMVLSHCREVVLLWIHRSYFAQAIIDCPTNPLRSQYASSFLATYRASGIILMTIKNQFHRYPSLCARFWLTWTYAFSAAAVFGFVVTRGPRSPLASAAILQLDTARELFAQAAKHSRRAAKALPLLNKWSEKAHAALAAATRGTSQDGALWTVKVEDDGDELEIFAGKTRLVESKRPSPSPNVEAAKVETQQQAQEQGAGVQGTGAGVQAPQVYAASAVVQHAPPAVASLPSGIDWVPPEGIVQEQPPPQAYARMSYQQQQQQQQQQTPQQHSQPQQHQHPDMYLPPPFAGSAGYHHPPTPTAGADYSSWPQGARQAQPQSQVHHAGAYIPPTHSHSHPHPHPHPHSHAQTMPQQPYAGYIPQQFLTGYADSYMRAAPEHGRAVPQMSLHPHPHPHAAAHAHAHPPPGTGPGQVEQHPAYMPPPELVHLGLASRDSRLGERWTSFMHENGFLDGFDYDRTS